MKRLAHYTKENREKFMHPLTLREQIIFKLEQEFKTLSYIEEKYISYLIYKDLKEQMKSISYENVYQTFKLFDNLPFEPEEVHSINPDYEKFSLAYHKYKVKLESNGILIYRNALKQNNKQLDFENNLKIWRFDALNLRERQSIYKKAENIEITYSYPLLDQEFIQNNFKIIKSQDSLQTAKITHISSKDLVKDLLEMLKNPRTYIVSTKEINLLMHYLEIDENYNAIYSSAISKKFNLSNNKNSKDYDKLKMIAKILHQPSNTIFEFLETANFAFNNKIIEDPITLKNTPHNIIYIKQNKNPLFPEDLLNEAPTTLSYLSTISSNITIIDKYEVSTQYIINDITKLPTNTIEKISYSQIKSYETCPYQYKLRYVNRLKEPLKPYFIFGEAIHLALEYAVNHNINKKETLLNIIKMRLNQNIEEIREKYFLYLKKAQTYLEHFLEENRKINNKYNNISTEMEISHEIKNKKFIGYVDRIIEHKSSKDIVIIDYKTSQSQNNHKTIEDAETQIHIYSHFLKKEKNIVPKKGVVWLLDSEKKHIFDINYEKAEKLENKIIDILEKIEKNEFPTKPGNHCKLCSYKLLCKMHHII